MSQFIWSQKSPVIEMYEFLKRDTLIEIHLYENNRFTFKKSPFYEEEKDSISYQNLRLKNSEKRINKNYYHSVTPIVPIEYSFGEYEKTEDQLILCFLDDSSIEKVEITESKSSKSDDYLSITIESNDFINIYHNGNWKCNLGGDFEQKCNLTINRAYTTYDGHRDDGTRHPIIIEHFEDKSTVDLKGRKDFTIKVTCNIDKAGNKIKNGIIKFNLSELKNN